MSDSSFSDHLTAFPFPSAVEDNLEKKLNQAKGLNVQGPPEPKYNGGHTSQLASEQHTFSWTWEGEHSPSTTESQQ